MGGVEPSCRKPRNSLDRRQRFGRSAEIEAVGVEGTSFDTEIVAAVPLGGKKERNVGVTTKLTNF